MRVVVRAVFVVAALATARRSHAGYPTLVFDRHDLASDPYGQVTQGVNVGDLDGDGRPDIVVGGDRYLVWYRNPAFVPQAIATGLKYAGGSAIGVYDIDGDGRLDVVVGRYPLDAPDRRETVWFANTAAGWQVHPMSTDAYCHDVAFGDLDGDGRADMACTDLVSDRVAWLQAPADPTTAWPVHPIDERRRAQGVAIADVDGDRRLDVIAGRSWYRNVGGDGRAWEHVYYTRLRDVRDPRFDDYAKVSVLDLNDDGRPDVFATLFANSREGQVWAFLQPAAPLVQPWKAVPIDRGPLFGVHSQAVASFDGTTRPQILVGETNIGGFGFGPNPSPAIYVYRRVGNAADAAGWERTIVDRWGTHEAQAADLDGDGLADVAGSEENTELIPVPRDGVVSWWENRTRGRPTRVR